MMSALARIFVRAPIHDLAHPPKANIPALDALRSVAILLVMTTHFSAVFGKLSGAVNWFGQLPIVSGGGGRIGVDLFFVLSGYLIGGQLWRELTARDTVDIRRFMLRRIFRIWPLYFCVLAVVLFFRSGDTGPRGWTDLLFITNYINEGVVMGSWSLCTEEQFYLLAPLLLIIGASVGLPTRRYGPILLGLLVLLPVIRVLVWWRVTGDFQHRNPSVFAHSIYTPFHTHADGLVVGLLISYYHAMFGKRAGEGFLASGASVLAAAALFGIGHWLQREVFDLLGIALFFGAVVQYCLAHRPRWLLFVNLPAFYVISRLSYGMYLNHEYMQQAVAEFTLHSLPMLGETPALQEMLGMVVLFAASAAVSLGTYCLVERPFLQLRDVVLKRRKQEAVDRPSNADTVSQPAMSIGSHP